MAADSFFVASLCFFLLLLYYTFFCCWWVVGLLSKVVLLAHTHASEKTGAKLLAVCLWENWRPTGGEVQPECRGTHGSAYPLPPLAPAPSKLWLFSSLRLVRPMTSFTCIVQACDSFLCFGFQNLHRGRVLFWSMTRSPPPFVTQATAPMFCCPAVLSVYAMYRPIRLYCFFPFFFHLRTCTLYYSVVP